MQNVTACIEKCEGVLDGEGRKMSKSLGNVISPAEAPASKATAS